MGVLAHCYFKQYIPFKHSPLSNDFLFLRYSVNFLNSICKNSCQENPVNVHIACTVYNVLIKVHCRPFHTNIMVLKEFFRIPQILLRMKELK